MIESLGPRPAAPSGAAAVPTAIQAGEKIVNRLQTRVLPAEKVDRTAPAGPRPAFRHTYLEQLAAYWPEEPPALVEYAEPEPEAEPDPETRAAEDSVRILRNEGAAPTVDIRA